MAEVSKRDAALRSMVKATKYINTLPDSESMRAVQMRFELLEKAWDAFGIHHGKIIDVTGEKEIDMQEQEYERAEDVYMKAVGLFGNKLSELKAKERTKDHSDSDDSESTVASDAASTSRVNRRCSAIKLPKISLPSFSGGYDEWQSFRDLFTSMIHNNTSIGDSEKLHYLKTSLNGEAKGLLLNVLVTNANYKDSWEILLRRYNNKRVIVYTLINTILELPNASSAAESIKQLLDKVTQHIRALANLDQPTDKWDSWLIITVYSKLDANSKVRWDEQIASSTDCPVWSVFEKFLVERFRTLEGSISRPSVTSKKTQNKALVTSNNVQSFMTRQTEKCMLCSQDHRLYRCDAFHQKSIIEKRDFMKSSQLCYNCMSPHHRSALCRSKMRCQKCKRRHHTLLHSEFNSSENSASTSCNPIAIASTSTHAYSNQQPPPTTITSTIASTVAPTVTTHFAKGVSTYLLATALIKATGSDGTTHTLRALIDPGSMTSFITVAASRALGLQRQKTNMTIEGVGCTKADQAQGVVLLSFKSRIDNTRQFTVDALVLKNITAFLPTQTIEWHHWSHLVNLPLADPHFSQPGPIDVLLGADAYTNIIESEVIKGAPGSPIAQKTSLGYVIIGPNTAPLATDTPSALTFHCHPKVDDLLRQFWEIEELPAVLNRTADENECEKHYKDNYQRNSEGAFIVRLPLNKLPNDHLGHSRQAALQRLYQLERRFNRNQSLRQQYELFLSEYIQLNHMELVPDAQVSTPPHKHYYMPHHAIF